ncbi:hypothetical protein GCM10010294_07120 [Streptomyces griseoloalbus]|nr:hypothetical protein GCM10010294_07120 [Streptomyces griseoloalbus]
MTTVVIASRLRKDWLDHLTAVHASLARQSVPWEAVAALDGASPDRLPTPLAQDPRIRTTGTCGRLCFVGSKSVREPLPSGDRVCKNGPGTTRVPRYVV